MNSIQGIGISSMQMMGGMQAPRALTSDQKDQVKSILSKYDSENLTTEDAKKIFEEFRDAGIQPAAGMKETIEEAGFDADQLREMGMPDDQKPPEPPQGKGSKMGGSMNVQALQNLQSILSQYDLNDLSNDDQTNLMTQLEQSGLMNPGFMVDMSA
jgi:hypothetical protein